MTSVSPTASSKEAARLLEAPTARVHLPQQDGELPLKPENWTRFVCISDTHCHTFPVPPGDVLLHSGDLTHTGTLAQLEMTVEWLQEQPHQVKIIIAGNHDLTLHESFYETNWKRWHLHVDKQPIGPIKELLTGERSLKSGIVYLQDALHQFQLRENGRTWSVYGSPWSPEFCNWAFNYERGREARARVATFPQVDILLTHGPPYGILDRVVRGDRVGCEALAARLGAEIRPRLHVFGHIHEDRGVQIRSWTKGNEPRLAGSWSVAPGQALDDPVVFVNASNFPLRYSESNRAGTGVLGPIVVDLAD